MGITSGSRLSNFCSTIKNCDLRERYPGLVRFQRVGGWRWGRLHRVLCRRGELWLERLMMRMILIVSAFPSLLVRLTIVSKVRVIYILPVTSSFPWFYYLR